MRSHNSYTPRHGGRHRAPSKAATMRAAVRRPVVGGALAVGMLGSVGATVALGDPSHVATQDVSASAAAAPAPGVDALTADTTRLADDRRATNVSRSASREQDRLAVAAAKKKAADEKKKAAADKAAAERKALAERKAEEEQAKPVSQREFTAEEIALIQADPAPYGKQLAAEYGWGEGEFSCLVSLWIGESDWRWNAENSSSGAYGIPQSLPASKMASAGADWKTNPITQMEWGMDYIKQSYGTPCGAKRFWDSNNPHWY